MTEILVFHSVYGLRPGIDVFAKELRDAGHIVHTPDLYDGRVFDTRIEGIAYRDELGLRKIGDRALAAAAELPRDLVYAGFSLGSAAAQLLAQTRPGARGALLLHGCLPTTEFEVPWPGGVPVAIHTTEDDPWVDQKVCEELIAEAHGELYRYPGDAHLFLDPDLPDHDPLSAARAMDRILEFLRRIG